MTHEDTKPAIVAAAAAAGGLRNAERVLLAFFGALPGTADIYDVDEMMADIRHLVGEIEAGRAE